MGISFVGQADASGSTASLGISYASASGNTLIATGRGFASGTALYPAITDSAGNTWHYSTTTTANPPAAPLPEGVSGTFVAWTFQDHGPVTSVTVGMTGAAFMEVNVSEWSGITSETTGNYTQNSTGDITAPALAVGAGNLAVGFAYNDSGDNYAGAPSGATALTLSGETSAAVFQVFSSSGTLGWDWGATSTYGKATVVAAVFAGSGSGPPAQGTVSVVNSLADSASVSSKLAASAVVTSKLAATVTIVNDI